VTSGAFQTKQGATVGFGAYPKVRVENERFIRRRVWRAIRFALTSRSTI